ncbi:hypothetical protein QQ045_023855 [Rhodiola kirilowii]
MFCIRTWSAVFLFVSANIVGSMPKVKTNRVKYPEGWELIEPTIRELQAKMREAENDPHDGKRKCEILWPIFKIAHQKSRYIFDLYHRRKEISKELFEFCCDQGYADRNLIAKWKKPGYERLCCLRCMQPRDHNFATTCVCRVPKHLREEKLLQATIFEATIHGPISTLVVYLVREILLLFHTLLVNNKGFIHGSTSSKPFFLVTMFLEPSHLAALFDFTS